MWGDRHTLEFNSHSVGYEFFLYATGCRSSCQLSSRLDIVVPRKCYSSIHSSLPKRRGLSGRRHTQTLEARSFVKRRIGLCNMVAVVVSLHAARLWASGRLFSGFRTLPLHSPRLPRKTAWKPNDVCDKVENEPTIYFSLF